MNDVPKYVQFNDTVATGDYVVLIGKPGVNKLFDWTLADRVFQIPDS